MHIWARSWIPVNILLSKIYQDLTKNAIRRAKNRDFGDDDKGGIPLILGYIDDINVLIPLQDVHLFLKLFKQFGEPLGAILNTE